MKKLFMIGIVLFCSTVTWSQNQESIDDVLTLEEAARLLKTDPDTVRLMAEAWTIPGQRLIENNKPGPWRFSREALLAWLEQREARSRTRLDPELLESSQQFQQQRQHQFNNPSQTDATHQQVDASIGTADSTRSASDMFVREQSVLLNDGEFSLDVGLYYQRRDREFFLEPLATGLSTLETRSVLLQSVARYSPVSGIELYTRASGISDSSKLYFAGQKVGDSQTNSRGEVLAGLRYVALKEAWGRPKVILGLESQIKTGNTSEAYGANISLVKSLDPAILFGSLSYQWTNSQEFRELSLLEPEEQASLSMGYAFALNDRLSLNTVLISSYQAETEFSRVTLRENDTSVLQLGLTTQITPDIYLQPSVSFSLTGTGTAFSMGVNIPMSFGGSK